MHAKACEASRGHISRFPRLGYTSRSRQTSATEYTVRPEIFSIRATALESYALFRCVQSVVLVLSMPLYRQWLIYQIATLLLVTGFVKLFCLLLV